MSVKVQVGSAPLNLIKPYPKLMRHKSTGEIWLMMSAVDRGTKLFTAGTSPASLWEDYNEPLTLQNE